MATLQFSRNLPTWFCTFQFLDLINNIFRPVWIKIRLNRRFEIILSNILSEFIAGNCTNEVTIEVSFTKTDELKTT